MFPLVCLATNKRPLVKMPIHENDTSGWKYSGWKYKIAASSLRPVQSEASTECAGIIVVESVEYTAGGRW